MSIGPTTILGQVAVGIWVLTMVVGDEKSHAPGTSVPLIFSDGHEIGKDDFGRPVVLMAAALGVKQEEFRKAFIGVTPARGREPNGNEAWKYKEAHMKVLGPLGVTNERMDEVADYYCLRPQRGELWPTTAAKANAIVANGKIQRNVITECGSGYRSPPTVKVDGFPDVEFKMAFGFSKDLKKNGAVAAVEVVTAKEPKAGRSDP